MPDSKLPANATSLAQSSPASRVQWVVCLCAAWCGVCRDYRSAFDQAAQAHPELKFLWVDVEDEADLVGDAEVETFPTVLIAGAGQIHFVGPLQPQVGSLLRLIEAKLTDPAPRVIAAPAYEALLAQLQAGRTD
ncbi:MAG: thioredoxin family protein [Pseudomonadota bacterium]